MNDIKYTPEMEKKIENIAVLNGMSTNEVKEKIMFLSIGFVEIEEPLKKLVEGIKRMGEMYEKVKEEESKKSYQPWKKENRHKKRYF